MTAACLLSFALQFGADASSIRKALSHAGALGAVLDLLAAGDAP
jgi:hypothetical protein